MCKVLIFLTLAFFMTTWTHECNAALFFYHSNPQVFLKPILVSILLRFPILVHFQFCRPIFSLLIFLRRKRIMFKMRWWKTKKICRRTSAEETICRKIYGKIFAFHPYGLDTNTIRIGILLPYRLKDYFWFWLLKKEAYGWNSLKDIKTKINEWLNTESKSIWYKNTSFRSISV